VISNRDVVDWFAKQGEDHQCQLLEAKKIKVIHRDSRLSYARRKKAGEG
jgi:hypothetical protein